MFFGRPFGGLVPGAQGDVLAVLLRTGASLTGRQVHLMVRASHSLWSVQEALKTLAKLGLVTTQTVGRAGLHAINEEHASIPSLRALLDPIQLLVNAVDEQIDDHVHRVILFGSIARGEAGPESDIDLAVIADPGWEGRADLAEHVSQRLGNSCDVLVFGPQEFERLTRTGEPIVLDIVRDGVTIVDRSLARKAEAIS